MEKNKKGDNLGRIDRRTFLKYSAATGAAIGIAGFPNILRSKEKKIVLGISSDITGITANEGRAEKDACILAIEEWNKRGGINGQKIDYIFRNDGMDPVRVVGNCKLFIKSGCCAAFGGTASTSTIPATKTLTPVGIPFFGYSSALPIYQRGPDGKVYYFAGCGSQIAMGKACAHWAAKMGFKKVAILNLNVAWPRDLRRLALEWIEKEYGDKYGIECIKTIEADIRATDLTPQVAELKDANPDAVFGCVYAPSAKKLMRAFMDLDYHPPWIDYWGAPEVTWMGGERTLCYNANGFSYASGAREDTVAKKKEFAERFGYEPVEHWVLGYDSVNITLTAIKEVGPDPAAIRDWIATESYGMPILGGREGHFCKIRDIEETWFEETMPYYSMFEGTDYAFVRVDREGNLHWYDL